MIHIVLHHKCRYLHTFETKINILLIVCLLFRRVSVSVARQWLWQMLTKKIAYLHLTLILLTLQKTWVSISEHSSQLSDGTELKRLLPPKRIRMFGPKTVKFVPKYASFVILGQILAFLTHFVPRSTKKQCKQGA